MKKYKLINKHTGEEHLCEKVTIDGFEYYVSDETVGFTYNKPTYNSDGRIGLPENRESRKVIATNNPSSEIPKVVDEVLNLAFKTIEKNQLLSTTTEKLIATTGFYEGYMQSQETNPFSEEDLKFVIKESLYYWNKNACSEKEAIDNILQIWKEQQPKTLYYE